MRKIIVSILIICLLFSINVIQFGQAEVEFNGPQNLPRLPSSYISFLRRRIGSNDEGSHYKDNCTHQEWWYYIAFFNKEDSELKNWSMMVSFNQMGIFDMLFCAIFEENNIYYGGKTTRWKGAMQASGPYVNVEFENSSIVGRYPEWQINAEKKKKDGSRVIVNVTYKAKMLPMWLFFNSGLNSSNSRIGHYCILNNDVNGTVTINETSYNVSGGGYHEHSWINDKKRNRNRPSLLPIFLRNENKGGIPEWQLTLNIWDFCAMFLDNGWNIFSAKICQQSLMSKLLPGSLWITNDYGKNIIECRRFQFKYFEMQNTSIPNLKIPTKIQIKALFLRTFFRHPLRGLVRLNLILEVKNLLEFKWGGDNITAAVFEAACKVHGHIKWFGNNVELNGNAMLELTRYVDTNED